MIFILTIVFPSSVVLYQTHSTMYICIYPCLLDSKTISSAFLQLFTFLACLRDDVCSTLAHDAGHIEGTVGLAGDGDGTKHCLCLQLVEGQDIKTRHIYEHFLE